MTKTMNVLAHGSTATLVHLTEEEVNETSQRAHVALCGRKVQGYVSATGEVTCTKCNRLAA
jgi:hypothetical protein